jgi:hypothetical protein
MDLHRLCLADRKSVRRFLAASLRRQLAVYNFAAIYIWRNLFDIFWAKIEGSLCLFFQDNNGAFMNLCPLGKKITPQAVAAAFQAMDGMNKNPALSRIENAEAGELAFYQGLGYDCRQKSADYLYLRKGLADLKGDAFKSKRACVNYFTRNYDSQYLEYGSGHRRDCLRLYKNWMAERSGRNRDPVYQGMLKDSFSALQALLEDYPALGCIGRIVRIAGEIKGFTFGYELDQQTFCVLFEVCDLSCKGLSQYIFRRLCAELSQYRYMNIMDDSGLANLKKTKESYRPAKLIPSFIVTRKNA